MLEFMPFLKVRWMDVFIVVLCAAQMPQSVKMFRSTCGARGPAATFAGAVAITTVLLGFALVVGGPVMALMMVLMILWGRIWLWAAKGRKGVQA